MSETHMTLGEAVDYLATLNPAAEVRTASGAGVEDVASYRGYYDCLALEPGVVGSVRSLHALLENAIGQTFTGYKGGEFRMHRKTPLFLAASGHTGTALIGFAGKDPVVILTEEDPHILLNQGVDP